MNDLFMEIDETFPEINEAFPGMNDVFPGMNDVFPGMNDVFPGMNGSMRIKPPCFDFFPVQHIGKNIANPSSLLLSSVMMLEYISWNEAANPITAANLNPL
jgi:hypothetical protein